MENCKETSVDEISNCECMKDNDEERLPFSSNLVYFLNIKRRKREFLEEKTSICGLLCRWMQPDDW